ncbi:hypothetical protein ABS764_13835 [Flavobacterium sp. ST-87]|uniref:CDP-Glycerol:Poly(Glycerophosphate) glycerophosphotransferase n=1 Tax=Flavobacterium plantiphilum TaxID=3163297 RepID=A0ABW8XVL9_9FLAO
MSWDKFIQINNSFKLIKNNVDFNKAIAHDILIVAYFKPPSYYAIFKSFIKTLNVKDFVKHFNLYTNIYTCFVDRMDHIKLVENCRSDIPNSILLQSEIIQPKLKISIINIFISIHTLINARQLKIDIKSKLYLASQLCFNLNIEKDLRNELIKRRNRFTNHSYISLISSYGIENLLCQVINHNSTIRTYSLSHGVSYINFKQQKPLDYINGFNISSQYVIVWGKSSKRDLNKNFDFPQEKILVGGNPKYPAKKINLKIEFKNCIVLLPREIYDKSNLELLDLIAEYKKNNSVKVSVKLHPSLNYQKYEGIANQLGFEICSKNNSLINELSSDKYDFAIAYNTTAYYEAMYFNLFCLRYDKNENELFDGLEDKFSTVSDLEYIIKQFKSIDTNIVDKQAIKLLEETLGMGINNYAEILNSQ